MATYNGSRFLDRQTRSILAQTIGPLALTVSDDGSTDETLPILSGLHSSDLRDFKIIEGPGKGSAENFRRLITQASPNEDFYAFADQDDVWHPEKLERAIARLRPDSERPALHCGRTRLIDETDRPIGHSPLFTRPPSFGNALVQNIAGGNTMVMNRAAFRVLQASACRTPFLTHDWWTYLIVSGAGGTVSYDPVPTVDYRQHRANLVGNGMRPLARLRRLQALLSGRYGTWTDRNVASLQACTDLLSDRSIETLDLFMRARRARGPAAVRLLSEGGIDRQGHLGAIGLRCAIAFGRI